MSNENEWITGQVTLSLNGTKIEMEMTVPANPVKPTRMLPISCQAGCGACCNQPVPVAEIEAYQIAELVENMDEPRRSIIKQKFDDACRHFHETKWFERMDDYDELSPLERMDTALEYFYDAVPCPFLENDSCSIHAVRPLACREYLVTSPAENCAAPTAETIRSVKMFMEPSKILRETARSKNLRKVNFVPMIRSLEWAAEYPEKMPEKKGTEWMTDFVNRLANAKPEAESETAQTIDK